tara:strand:- start:2448 stop:3071 length:624 start_codon:yes stop_codon:yes gene_type:complete
MARIVDRGLKAAISSQLRGNKSLTNQGRVIIEKQFKIVHKKLMSDFESHPVTRELKGGAGSSNISGTLTKGNLFGFIGFESSDDPVSDIRTLLSKANILIKQRRFGKFGFIWTYAVNIASKSDLYKATPLPWAQGASWLQQLEGRGIANLGQYMFKKTSSSRSGAGIQSGTREGGRLKINYMGALIDKFEQDLNDMSGGTKISKSYF